MLRAARIVVVAVVAASIMGCAGGAASPPAQPAASGASASLPGVASAVPRSAGPAASAPAGSPSPTTGPRSIAPPTAGALTVTDGELQAGSYTSTSLGVTIEFELPEGMWMGQEDWPDVGFGLIAVELAGGISVVPFDGAVFADPCAPGKVETIDRSAAAFVEWLAEHSELESDEAVPVTLGGQEAVQLDVDATVGETCPDVPWNFLWVLPEPAGDFHLQEGVAARFIVADVGERTIVLVVESFQADDFEDVLDEATPIIESMTIQP